jgi:hypothetical protein
MTIISNEFAKLSIVICARGMKPVVLSIARLGKIECLMMGTDTSEIDYLRNFRCLGVCIDVNAVDFSWNSRLRVFLSNRFEDFQFFGRKCHSFDDSFVRVFDNIRDLEDLGQVDQNFTTSLGDSLGDRYDGPVERLRCRRICGDIKRGVDRKRFGVDLRVFEIPSSRLRGIISSIGTPAKRSPSLGSDGAPRFRFKPSSHSKMSTIAARPTVCVRS